MVIGVKWFVDLMLCCWGCWFVRNWLDFNVIGGRVVGWLCCWFHLLVIG